MNKKGAKASYKYSLVRAYLAPQASPNKKDDWLVVSVQHWDEKKKKIFLKKKKDLLLTYFYPFRVRLAR